MLAEKISGYAEAKSAFDESSAIVAAKHAEVKELDSKITDTTEAHTAINEQLNAAPLQMAKNELSTEEFIRLRYDADALQAMIQGLNEVRAAQKTALSSLSQEQNRLQQRVDTMVKNYVEKMAENFVIDAVKSVNEPLKFFISSIIAGVSYGAKSDEIYQQIGLQLAKLVYDGQQPNVAYNVALSDAKRYTENVKQSFLTEV